MSLKEIQRFDENVAWGDAFMDPSDDGNYVLFEDHSAPVASLHRQYAEVVRAAKNVVYYMGDSTRSTAALRSALATLPRDETP